MHLKAKRLLDYYVGGVCLRILYTAVRLLSYVLRRDHALGGGNGHIVFIKMLGGGNLFTLLASLETIKRHRPEVELSVVCSPGLVPFAKSMKMFDEIKVVDDRGFWRMLRSFLSTVAWLMKHADTIVDLEVHSRATTVLATLSAARNRIGLIDSSSRWRRKLYTHSIYHNPARSRYVPYDAVATLFNLEELRVSEIRASYRAKIMADDLPKNAEWTASGDFAVFAVGCSDLSHERKLSDDRWRELMAASLAVFPARKIVFLGDQKDRVIADSILSVAELPIKKASVNLCGQTTLEGSIQILARARAFLGVDSALMHYARFLDIPTLGFWGPTDPSSLLRPLRVAEKHLYRGIGCSPCVHFSEQAPCLGINICMNHAAADLRDAIDFLKTSSTKKNVLESYHETSWIYFPNEDKPHLHVIKICLD